MARILSDDQPRSRPPLLTYAVMAAWVVMWIAQALRPDDGNLVDSVQAMACRWGMVPEHIVGGGAAGADPCVVLSAAHSPWLEVLSAQFLHISWWHLLGNLLFLWVFGPAVEERLGRLRFLPFALGCAYAAFLVEAIADPSSVQPVIGGSGVVATVLGAYLVLFPRARLRLRAGRPSRTGGIPAWLPITIWAAFETAAALSGASPGAAHWLHLAGFALGALLARPAATALPSGRAPAAPVEWVRVTIARNQPEAELIQAILADAGITTYLRRTAGFDVPDYLAGGPRDVMVPGTQALEAHGVINPHGDDVPPSGR